MNENATNCYLWKTSPPKMTNRGWMNWVKIPPRMANRPMEELQHVKIHTEV